MKKNDITPGTTAKRILVAYFSHSGNTHEVANQIHKAAGGDIIRILTVEPYPSEYGEAVEKARQELKSEYHPPLKTEVANMATYEVVFVGYPDWWSSIPMPVASFLSKYDFSGKTIAPFCTHEGSGMGHSVTDIKNLCRKSTVLNGLAVRGRDVKNAQKTVAEWLREIKIID